MARRSQCSSAGDNPLDRNYLPPHYREEYRLAIDALVEDEQDGYYEFLHTADVVDFLSRPEMEHIKSTVQGPSESAHPEQQGLGGDADGSSDTYWPVHSDLDAPGLDLGWPQHQRFFGPTEVTTLVNPSDPNMPSIKEQARRLIKDAQMMVAVAMDKFTDVDIFADLLDAAMRNVAVYILLDELNAHLFTAMVANCRVNLEQIQSMRVRTVSGSTYFCRTGKYFKGQMMERFLLVDCRAVLSGSYSFMWSFEKLHRCLAHLFLGQLVTSFDEEFRILYAQSVPLVTEHAPAPMQDYSNFSGSHCNTDKTHIFRNPREYLTIGTIRHPEWAGHSLEDHADVDHNMLPLRRSESPHSSVEDPSMQMRTHRQPSQQFRLERSFTEQGWPMMTPNTMSGSKRRGYVEGFQGGYFPPRKHMMRRNMNPEDIETQSAHSQREQYPHQRAGQDPGYDVDDKFRSQGHTPSDQLSESGYPLEVEPSDDYDHVQRFLQSHFPVEMEHEAGNLSAPGEDPCSQSNPKRPSIGHAYACQKSPTQLNPADHKRSFNLDRKPQDTSQKQGMREWRISSFLSAFDDAGEEDMPQLKGMDPFDEPPYPSQGKLFAPELPELRLGTREFPKFHGLPRYSKPTVSEESKDIPVDLTSMQTDARTSPTTTSVLLTDGAKAEEIDGREPKETSLTREESFRRRPNPAIKRGSRLRNSLIFHSKMEQYSSQESQNELPTVAQLLEKRRSITREPFQWSSMVKPPTTEPSTDNPTAGSSKAKDSPNEKEMTKNEEKDSVSQKEQPSPTLEEKPKITQNVHPTTLLQRPAFCIDMNDPDSRLRFFKELAAQRKAEQASAKSAEGTSEQAVKKPSPVTSDTVIEIEPTVKTSEISLHPTDTPIKSPVTTAKRAEARTPEVPSDYTAKQIDTQRVTEKDPKHATNDTLKSSTLHNNYCDELPQVATDAEKIKLKKQRAEGCGSSPNLAPADWTSLPSLPIPTQPGSTSLLQPIPTQPGSTSLPQPIPTQPGSTSTISSPKPVPTEACLPIIPTPTKYSSPHTPASTEASSPVNRITIESSSPSKHFPNESILLPSPTLSSSTPSPTPTETSSCPNSSTTETSPCPNPAPIDSSAPPNPTPKEAHSSLNSSPKPQSSPTKTSVSANHVPTCASSLTNHTPTLFSSTIQPSPTESSSPPSPTQIESSSATNTLTECQSCNNPAPTDTSSSQNLDSTKTSHNTTPTDDCLLSNLTPTQSSSPLSPNSTGCCSLANPTPPECSLSVFIPTKTVSSSNPIATESSSQIKPTLTESCSTSNPTPPESTSPTNSTPTESSSPPNPTPTKASTLPSLAESSSPLNPASTEASSAPSPTPAESCSSHYLNFEESSSEGQPKQTIMEQTQQPEGSLPSKGDGKVRGVYEDQEVTDQTMNTAKEMTSELVCTGSQSAGDTNEAGSTVTPQTTDDSVNHESLPAEHTKSNQSRYQASTANVLYCSNLRDDTKVLLEQISANSQSRTAQTKLNLAVTDDAKGDEVSRSADVDKETSAHTQSRIRLFPSKVTPEEREKLLKKMESKRKENKVYSRFETF